jgi:Uma2 family endonuclease
MELKTKSDWLKLPADCYAYQLIHGEIVDWPTMTIYENKVRTEIGMALYKHVISNKLGDVFFVPIDLYLTEHDIFQPDIIFTSNEHLDSIREDGVYEPPDIVIEVVSEPTAHFDYGPKKGTYEKSGVKEYWIVNPKESKLECFVNSKDGFQTAFSGVNGTVCSAVLPDFCGDVISLFQDRY